jgi:hypothetical protein
MSPVRRNGAGGCLSQASSRLLHRAALPLVVNAEVALDAIAPAAVGAAHGELVARLA